MLVFYIAITDPKPVSKIGRGLNINKTKVVARSIQECHPMVRNVITVEMWVENCEESE